MLVEDQARTIAFLTNPAEYGLSPEDVRTRQTHISLIVLAGERVFKLKRAVRLPYLDFSTAALRLAACERELAMNRRTAPTLYRGVRRITREADGHLAFNGGGDLVDAVVEMGRFEENALFDRMAERGTLTTPLLTELAREIARFHKEAPADRNRGGYASVADVLAINERALASTSLFASKEVASFNASFRIALTEHRPLLEARAVAGSIRRCHGDLHLRNICLLEGKPTLFDCLEFDDALATSDVLYDLAFLLMDLWHRGRRSEANLVFNRYLDAFDQIDGLPLVPFFMALRAAVRAHVGATQAEDAEAPGRETIATEARAYFDLARRLLEPAAARLIAIGGRSGTGKSTIAAAVADRIAPAPGARILASDRIRKAFHGVTAETRLPADAYRPEVSERVYGILAEQVERTLASGRAVIADAVFDRVADRERIARIATEHDLRFTGIWLEAPQATVLARVEARRGDPSDADAAVVRAQLERDPGPIDWHVVPSGADRSQAQAAVVALLKIDEPRPV